MVGQGEARQGLYRVLSLSSRSPSLTAGRSTDPFSLQATQLSQVCNEGGAELPMRLT